MGCSWPRTDVDQTERAKELHQITSADSKTNKKQREADARSEANLNSCVGGPLPTSVTDAWDEAWQSSLAASNTEFMNNGEDDDDEAAEWQPDDDEEEEEEEDDEEEDAEDYCDDDTCEGDE